MPPRGYYKPPRYPETTPCPVLTIAQAAREFNISPKTLIYHVERGNLEAWLLEDNRLYLISRKSLLHHFSSPVTQQT